MKRQMLVPVEDDWRRDAACQSTEAQPQWFGPVHFGNDWAGVQKAIEFCRECPVAAQCYAAGRADPHAAGVYGGRYLRGRATMAG